MGVRDGLRTRRLQMVWGRMNCGERCCAINWNRSAVEKGAGGSCRRLGVRWAGAAKKLGRKDSHKARLVSGSSSPQTPRLLRVRRSVAYERHVGRLKLGFTHQATLIEP